MVFITHTLLLYRILSIARLSVARGNAGTVTRVKGERGKRQCKSANRDGVAVQMCKGGEAGVRCRGSGRERGSAKVQTCKGGKGMRRVSGRFGYRVTGRGEEAVERCKCAKVERWNKKGNRGLVDEGTGGQGEARGSGNGVAGWG